MSDNQIKRVAIYARVSTPDQIAENQLLDMRRYCSIRGWTITHEFVDVGISGAKKDRPALNELMGLVRRQKLQNILVWRFDRFARSMSHLVSALEEFNDRGIGFASMQEGIDTTTASGKMVFGVIAALAEFERQLIIERIHAGLRRALAEGKKLGRAPLPKDKIVAILERRGKSVRTIAAEVGVGKSVVSKVQRLWFINDTGGVSTKDVPNVASSIDEADVAI